MPEPLKRDCRSYERRVFLDLAGEMEAEERQRWDGHLEGCPRCRRERAEVAEILGLTGAVASTRGPVRSQRGGGRTELKVVIRRLAASVLFFLAGLAAGMLLHRDAAAGRQAAELQAEVETLRAEVGELQRLKAVATLVEGSAGDRLLAVTGLDAARADRRVVAALLHALEHDPNVNVRLAALDALRRRTDLEAAHGRLVALLQSSSSPALRIALIDLLVEHRVGEASGVLRKLADDGHDPALQRRARWALGRLS